MPRYIDPTNDFAFKRLFGDQSKTDIVISFLNSILDYQSRNRIVSVVINDPANQTRTGEYKFSIVDILCTDQEGRQYIIEMQVASQDYYQERSVYYSATRIHKQLNKGDYYGKLVPVIFVAVLDFSTFEDKEYLSHYRLCNVEKVHRQLPLMDFYFIELKKFDKKLEQLETEADKWIYLLKKADSLKEIPKQFKDTIDHEAFEHAFDTLNESSLSESELAIYDKVLDDRRVEEDVLNSSERRGALHERQAIVLKLLAQNVSIEIIALSTGFSLDEINQLREKNCVKQ